MFTVLLANGSYTSSPETIHRLKQADLVIAVDGGANQYNEFGIVPDIIVGDLDSISPENLAQLEQNRKTKIIRYPRRKNATDLELALDLALKKGASCLWIEGGLGGRWDMSLANIMLAAAPRYRAVDIFLGDDTCIIRILHSGKKYNLTLQKGQLVSLLPLCGDVSGITLKGFEYPLEDATITFGSSRGVSNVAADENNRVHFQKGILLCVLQGVLQ
ncbi:MAG: thiamine diphosphokinase [Desulfobacterales bacterium]|nr:MAG: thiamine diphosphokinase [Desulfobacterales bacterium]